MDLRQPLFGSLLTRMITLLVIALSVQTTSAYFLLRYTFDQNVSQNIHASARSHAHTMQSVADYHVSQGDLTALTEHLHVALHSNYVTDAVAINCSGKVFSAVDRSLLGKDLAFAFPDYSKNSLETMHRNNSIEVSPMEKDSAVYYSYIPIPCPSLSLEGEEPVKAGALILCSDFSAFIEKEKQFYMLLGLLQFLLSALFLFIGTLLLYKFITAKLSALSSGMQTFSSDDHSFRHRPHGINEIDHIGAAFNKMADTIQRQFIRIQNTNRRLLLTDKVFELTSVGVVILSKDLMILDVNPAFIEMNSYELNEIVGKPFDFLIHDMPELEKKSLISDATLDGTATREFWARSARGKRFRKSIKLSSMRDDQGQITNYFVNESNVTEDHMQKLQLRALATTDSLTGLKNRRQFEIDSAEIELTTAGCCAIVSIDLDGLKEINGKYGHLAGDRFLEATARRLDQQVANISLGIYRLGGDEFCVILNQPGDIDELTRICRAITAAVEGTVKIDMATADLTIGLGVSIYDPLRHKTFQDLIKESDIALKEAKRSGRSSFFIASVESLVEQERRTNISLALKSPKLEEQVRVSYLPKVDIQNNILSGAEALIRWTSPDLGFVKNDEFIPIAEETGDIVKIDEWVMRRAISDAALFGKLIDGFQTTINVSPRQLFKLDYAEELIRNLEISLVDAENFSLEITEWTAIQHYDRFIPVLNTLRAAGISVELDDFGTGHSSLVNLHKLPIDALKIDRDFVHSMADNTVSLEIVRSIIHLARSLKMTIIAEGVENLQQLELLRELGCEYCQGYLYSEPLIVENEAGLRNAISQWQDTIDTLK